MKENKNKSEIIEDESKKGIIIILIAIAVVLGLIVLTAYLSKNEDENPADVTDNKVEQKIDENLSRKIVNESNELNTVSVANKIIKVRYLDINGEQIGKTQRISSLDDRVNEKAPRIDGMRFVEWILDYNEEEDIYYYIASYRENVEVVSEEVKVTYKKPATHTSSITPVETETENKTYDVEIEGEIPEIEEIVEDLTISEEYKHILVLRFYAPEDVTKENIENMKVTVRATSPNESVKEDQYSFNGEDETKSGRELLDSTDEEYENDIFYFDYYQETDTKTDTTIEVYWGNDPDANETIPPKDEYVETYNLNLDNVTNSEEKTAEKPTKEPTPEESNESQGQE